ncbi:MAG: hypothetical protein C0415_00770 [Thermodesulfovibrio sp.]|nr:hypothetical protein [Thermodesulfovibrio sp.]
MMHMDIKTLKEIWDIIKEYPPIYAGFLLIIISTVTFNFPPQGILFYCGLVLVILAGIPFMINYSSLKLGIKKVKLRRHEMQSLYDELHNKKAYKSKKLRYMGTSLMGLFAPEDMDGPRYNFVEIFQKNNALISMQVLLLDPIPPSTDQQQLKEVEDAQKPLEKTRELRKDIARSIGALGKIYSALSAEHKQKLEVKISNDILYVEFNMADNEMIATHYCCGGLGSSSPVYHLKKTKNGFFNRYLTDFNMLWNNNDKTSKVQFDDNGNVVSPETLKDFISQQIQNP